MNQIRISDATMKQTSEDFRLSFKEKIEFSKLLDRLGVDIIELEGIKNVRIDSLQIKSIAAAVNDSVIAAPVELSEDSVEKTWCALQQAKSPRLQIIAPTSPVQIEYLYHKKPDSMKVCEQLKKADGDTTEESFSDKVYCQSYSTKLKSGKDCVLMAVPLTIYNYTEGIENDGMVSEESARFENYRGECLDDSVSHTQIVDFLAKRKNRRRILEFYVGLAKELGEMGY